MTETKNLFERYNNFNSSLQSEIMSASMIDSSEPIWEVFFGLIDQKKYSTMRLIQVGFVPTVEYLERKSVVYGGGCMRGASNKSSDYDDIFDFQESFVAKYEYNYKNPEECDIYFYYPTGTPNIRELITKYVSDNFKESDSNSKIEIGLLSRSTSGHYYIEDYEIVSNAELNLDLNYNDDLKAFNEKFQDTLRNTRKSMTIINGDPGTGKTTYLRYIVSKMCAEGKDCVYLTPEIAYVLSSPDFVSNLHLFKNKILIVEDTENILINGDQRTTAITNLLNITDGFLSDIFNIHFVFTFNADINKLDPALLRKGRLTHKYEFKKLTEDKAKALCEYLHIQSDSRILAEIYNTEANIHNTKDERKIGFMQ